MSEPAVVEGAALGLGHPRMCGSRAAQPCNCGWNEASHLELLHGDFRVKEGHVAFLFQDNPGVRGYVTEAVKLSPPLPLTCVGQWHDGAIFYLFRAVVPGDRWERTDGLLRGLSDALYIYPLGLARQVLRCVKLDAYRFRSELGATRFGTGEEGLVLAPPEASPERSGRDPLAVSY